jgi:Type IV secretion system pilin
MNIHNTVREACKRAVYAVFIALVYAVGTTHVALAAPAPTISVQLKNPLKVTSITELLEALLGVVVVLATPVIVFFIIYSGFLYVTAQGNAEQVKQATRSLTYAIIGGVIVLGSFAIATIVKNLVGAF